MTTMLNMIPVDAKPNTVPKNTNKKDITIGKPTNGFAKVLNNQADKNVTDDVTAKAKDDNTNQLMAAIAGVVLPVSVNTTLPNQNTNQVIAGLVSDDAKVQTLNAVQVTNDQLLNAVQVETKNKLPELVNGGKVELGSTIGMNTSQNQLAILLAKMTNTSADSKNNNNDFVQVQSPVQVQPQLQAKQLIESVQQTNNSAKNVDNLINNTALLETVSPLAVMDNSNGVGKAIGRPADSKRIVADQENTETAKIADLVELVGNVDVKPLTAPHSAVSVVEAETNDGKSNMLALGGKEQVKVEPLLSDQAVKNADLFTSLLNQQAVKTDNQVSSAAVKQVPQQPVADSYNITSQIVDQARLIEGAKNTEMIIQLKPEHLGELTLKITVENGVVNASFHSNNSEVRNMIEASLQQLKQDMSNQGLKVENVNVYAGLGQFFSDGQRESQKKPEVKVQNKKNEEEFIEALESNSPVESSVDGSGVDYRV